MGKREYTPARAEANAKYDAKTYKKINIALRKEDDADIIRSIEEAKSKGLNLREWLRLYDRAKKGYHIVLHLVFRMWKGLHYCEMQLND